MVLILMIFSTKMAVPLQWMQVIDNDMTTEILSIKNVLGTHNMTL